MEVGMGADSVLWLLLGLVLGAAGTYYQLRADRRDAARFRNEISDRGRAHVVLTGDYVGRRVIIHNKGPGTAKDLDVVAATCGPSSLTDDPREAAGGDWSLPVTLAPHSSYNLPLRYREMVTGWVKLQLAWTEDDGTVRDEERQATWGL
jgi:hypothetical protein